jgi:beta-glucosidase
MGTAWLLIGRMDRSLIVFFTRRAAMVPLAGLFMVFALAGCALNPLGPFDPAPKVSSIPGPRMGESFAWGFSTSSYQYEDPDVTAGDPNYFSTDWDIFVAGGKAPPKGNALYSWSHFEKDLELLKNIRPTHYRFSIEWARVEPRPGEYNEAAIRGYARMARQLKELGIEPIVCLWHFTFPDWLYNKKNPGQSNWLHPMARERWNAYVEKIVRATSPYTKWYAPQNEPNGQITTAYLVGQWPPGMSLAIGHYHKAIAASAAMFRDAATRVKAIKPEAKILSVEALPWWERATLDPGGLIYNTMIHGNTDHLDRVYDVCDVLGINYYYTQRPGPIELMVGPKRRGQDFTMMGWRINPAGLTKEIKRVGDRYGKPMMITENGIATPDDAKRRWYMENHLAAIGQAIRDGYDVRGYLTWSLADNYEWHFGYTATFGLSHMNPKTLAREPKPSAEWFAQIIRRHPTVGSVARIQPARQIQDTP